MRGLVGVAVSGALLLRQRPHLRRKTTIRAGGPAAGGPVIRSGTSETAASARRTRQRRWCQWIHRRWPGLWPAVSQDSDAPNASSKSMAQRADLSVPHDARKRPLVGSGSDPCSPRRTCPPQARPGAHFPGTSTAFKFLGAPFKVPAQACPGWRCTTGPLRAGHSSCSRALLESGAVRRCRCHHGTSRGRPRRVCRTARCGGAVTARQAADCYGLAGPGGTSGTQFRRTGQ